MPTRIAHDVSDESKPRSSDVAASSSAPSFDAYMLSPNLLKGLQKAGFSRPSPIQQTSIPLGRCGVDLVVQAKSGTGKTAVFSIIALEMIVPTNTATQVLVMAPTREIACQIHATLVALAVYVTPSLTIKCFTGGSPAATDKRDCERCQIVVGTPGRLTQLIQDGALSTDKIRLFVLDEADELMLESFQKNVNWIFSLLPISKQVIVLSATYPSELDEMLKLYMRSPTVVRLDKDDVQLLGVKQYAVKCTIPSLRYRGSRSTTKNGGDTQKTVLDEKLNALNELLLKTEFSQCIIFSNFQNRAEQVYKYLTSCEAKWPAQLISAQLSQKDRNAVMKKLKNYDMRILVSTDLTARGVDAENVNLVINFDVPLEVETYLHRIGRAGRYGSFGCAITLYTPYDEEYKLAGFFEEKKLRIKHLSSSHPSDLCSDDGTYWSSCADVILRHAPTLEPAERCEEFEKDGDRRYSRKTMFDLDPKGTNALFLANISADLVEMYPEVVTRDRKGQDEEKKGVKMAKVGPKPPPGPKMLQKPKKAPKKSKSPDGQWIKDADRPKTQGAVGGDGRDHILKVEGRGSPIGALAVDHPNDGGDHSHVAKKTAPPSREPRLLPKSEPQVSGKVEKRKETENRGAVRSRKPISYFDLPVDSDEGSSVDAPATTNQRAFVLESGREPEKPIPEPEIPGRSILKKMPNADSTKTAGFDNLTVDTTGSSDTSGSGSPTGAIIGGSPEPLGTPKGPPGPPSLLRQQSSIGPDCGDVIRYTSDVMRSYATGSSKDQRFMTRLRAKMLMNGIFDLVRPEIQEQSLLSPCSDVESLESSFTTEGVSVAPDLAAVPESPPSAVKKMEPKTLGLPENLLPVKKMESKALQLLKNPQNSSGLVGKTQIHRYTAKELTALDNGQRPNPRLRRYLNSLKLLTEKPRHDNHNWRKPLTEELLVEHPNFKVLRNLPKTDDGEEKSWRGTSESPEPRSKSAELHSDGLRVIECVKAQSKLSDNRSKTPENPSNPPGNRSKNTKNRSKPSSESHSKTPEIRSKTPKIRSKIPEIQPLNPEPEIRSYTDTEMYSLRFVTSADYVPINIGAAGDILVNTTNVESATGATYGGLRSKGGFSVPKSVKGAHGPPFQGPSVNPFGAPSKLPGLDGPLPGFASSKDSKMDQQSYSDGQIPLLNGRNPSNQFPEPPLDGVLRHSVGGVGRGLPIGRRSRSNEPLPGPKIPADPKIAGSKLAALKRRPPGFADSLDDEDGNDVVVPWVENQGNEPGEPLALRSQSPSPERAFSELLKKLGVTTQPQPGVPSVPKPISLGHIRFGMDSHHKSLPPGFGPTEPLRPPGFGAPIHLGASLPADPPGFPADLPFPCKPRFSCPKVSLPKFGQPPGLDDDSSLTSRNQEIFEQLQDSSDSHSTKLPKEPLKKQLSGDGSKRTHEFSENEEDFSGKRSLTPVDMGPEKIAEITSPSFEAAAGAFQTEFMGGAPRDFSTWHNRYGDPNAPKTIENGLKLAGNEPKSSKGVPDLSNKVSDSSKAGKRPSSKKPEPEKERISAKNASKWTPGSIPKQSDQGRQLVSYAFDFFESSAQNDPLDLCTMTSYDVTESRDDGVKQVGGSGGNIPKLSEDVRMLKPEETVIPNLSGQNVLETSGSVNSNKSEEMPRSFDERRSRDVVTDKNGVTLANNDATLANRHVTQDDAMSNAVTQRDARSKAQRDAKPAKNGDSFVNALRELEASRHTGVKILSRDKKSATGEFVSSPLPASGFADPERDKFFFPKSEKPESPKKVRSGFWDFLLVKPRTYVYSKAQLLNFEKECRGRKSHVVRRIPKSIRTDFREPYAPLPPGHGPEFDENAMKLAQIEELEDLPEPIQGKWNAEIPAEFSAFLERELTLLEFPVYGNLDFQEVQSMLGEYTRKVKAEYGYRLAEVDFRHLNDLPPQNAEREHERNGDVSEKIDNQKLTHDLVKVASHEQQRVIMDTTGCQTYVRKENAGVQVDLALTPDRGQPGEGSKVKSVAQSPVEGEFCRNTGMDGISDIQDQNGGKGAEIGHNLPPHSTIRSPHSSKARVGWLDGSGTRQVTGRTSHLSADARPFLPDASRSNDGSECDSPRHSTSGPVNVSSGPVNVPSGPVNVPSGLFSVPSGPVNVTSGPVNVPFSDASPSHHAQPNASIANAHAPDAQYDADSRHSATGTSLSRDARPVADASPSRDRPLPRSSESPVSEEASYLAQVEAYRGAVKEWRRGLIGGQIGSPSGQIWDSYVEHMERFAWK